jgi:hypothetical protein
MQYTVVTFVKLEDLIKEVNSLMQKGWLPQGGICLNSFVVDGRYFQAMVKK